LKETATKSFAKEVLQTLLLTAVIFFGTRLAVQNYRVEGSSMYSTLHHSEFVLVNKLAYMRSEPQHGDIIVFNYPNDPSEQFVKRIIAVPGDSIEIRQGSVYVNGEKIIEPYIDRGAQLAGFAERDELPPQTVPSGAYFVMGDNRRGSRDSREWGFLERKFIVGKVWLAYWPPPDFGIIEHFELIVPEPDSRKEAAAPHEVTA
jgi:signal peptidase I